MKAWLAHIWDSLQSSYWFLPGLMIITGGALALVMVDVDRTLLVKRVDVPWLYGGGAEGARTLLGTVATSVATVAGVAFSITIAILSQASSLFGPRLLRNFMRDRGNQITLGTFLSTFIYSLLVLRTISAREDASFVPQAAVSVGVLMAIASVCVLIYFIHHIASSLQAPQIVRNVARELRATLVAAFPRPGAGRNGERSKAEAELRRFNHLPTRRVTASANGYVQVIDYETLQRFARRHDLVLRVAVRPGDFVVRDSCLAEAWPDKRIDRLDSSVCDTFIIGSQRTAEQDTEFAIRQMAEVAVRSLSPGINDPFTAMQCVDWLTATLCEIAQREDPPPYRVDDDGRPRLLLRAWDFVGIVEAAFNPIRQHARDSAPVTIRLLEALATIAEFADDQARLAELRRQAEMIVHQADEALPESDDRADVHERFERLAQIFERKRTRLDQRPASAVA